MTIIQFLTHQLNRRFQGKTVLLHNHKVKIIEITTYRRGWKFIYDSGVINAFYRFDGDNLPKIVQPDKKKSKKESHIFP